MKILNDCNVISSYIDKLGLTNIFSGELLSLLAIHRFSKQELLFRSDNEIKSLYLLLSGKAGVTPSSEEGRLSLLDILYPGDIIGDIEYFNNDKYYYSVIALSDSDLLEIPVKFIKKYLNSALFYEYACKNLAKKMKRTSFKYSRDLLYPLKNRLARYLIDLSMIHGNTIPEVQSKYTAEYFGISQRHLRRVLAELEAEQIISRDTYAVKLIDIDKLRILSSYR